ncbi:MAG: hypothetical protein AB1810_09700 [Pseudomonadota bacterium]
MEKIDGIIDSLTSAAFWATLLGVILMFAHGGALAGAFTAYAFIAWIALIFLRVLL